MVIWLRWHCPPDTGFEIRAMAVWGRARYLSVTEAPHNTNFHTWMGKKQLCFFQNAETGNRTPDYGVKGSGANHYPRAPALLVCKLDTLYGAGECKHHPATPPPPIAHSATQYGRLTTCFGGIIIPQSEPFSNPSSSLFVRWSHSCF